MTPEPNPFRIGDQAPGCGCGDHAMDKARVEWEYRLWLARRKAVPA